MVYMHKLPFNIPTPIQRASFSYVNNIPTSEVGPMKLGFKQL